MVRVALVLSVCALLTGCLLVPEGATPGVALTTEVASQFNFRGMTNVDAPVLQGDLAVALPTKLETGSIGVRAFANFDLENDVGDAWFPDGHAGEPSQIDLAATYSESYRGFDITSGVISYALQNPDDFPFAGERGETKEVFVNVARLVFLDLVPSLSVHYDFDEVDDWYANAAVARAFPINADFEADASVSLGYSGEDASDWTYGFPESGLADLRGTGRVSYFLDRNTTLHATLNASTIVDEDLRDWFDLIGIDSDTVWVALGVTWGY
jgi:hypothetical protein